MISNLTLNTLEYDKVLDKVSKFCMSKYGQLRVLELKPFEKLSDVEYALNTTTEAYKLAYTHVATIELSHENIDEILKKANVSSALSMQELLDVARVLKISRQAKQIIENINDNEIVNLKEIVFQITSHQDIELEIEKAIISGSEMSDNASYELKEIRAAITACNGRLRRTLNSYISSSDYSKYLQENIVTMRNGRYVIPVKSEYKSQIGGLVHDRSATGKALYIEPFDVVQANNELTELKLNETREIERILSALTNRVKGELENIAKNSDILINLDVIFAIAAYSYRNKCNKPIIGTDGEIKIINGRHPLIDRDSVVPVSLSLNDGERILLVTGPNTGGKTVSLKLTGLLTLMTMTGIFPPLSDGSKINVFSSVFADIGDLQSIENSLSTFSSHITNIVKVTDNIDSNSLVLFDELGGGTDPDEGAALAVAVLKHILNKGATAIITTHYNKLKDYALTDKRIKCASMDFDPVTYAPTYKLVMNSSGGSKALKIAERLGLNKSILDDAYSQIDPEKRQIGEILESAEKARASALMALEDAEKDRRKAENHLKNIEKKAEQLDEKNAMLDAKLKREAHLLLNDYISEADELIDELKEELKKGDERALFAARNIKSQIKKTLEYESNATVNKKLVFTDTPIEIGDEVFVSSLSKTAIVTKIDEKSGRIDIKLGALSTTVKIADVKKIAGNVKLQNKTQNTAIRLVREESEIGKAPSAEIDVRGQQVEEAIYNVDNFIDKCLISGYNEVRIVHGKGTGVLRRAIGEHFRTHRNIKTYRLGKYGEGEDGVTIAELK